MMDLNLSGWLDLSRKCVFLVRTLPMAVVTFVMDVGLLIGHCLSCCPCFGVTSMH